MTGRPYRIEVVKLLLIVSAAYTALVGLALVFFPLEFGRGAVPPDSPEELIAFLRLLGGPFLGIAVLNWLSRNARPKSLRPILLANAVGFGSVAANDVWGVFSGAARDVAAVFLVVHVAFTIAFVVATRAVAPPSPSTDP